VDCLYHVENFLKTPARFLDTLRGLYCWPVLKPTLKRLAIRDDLLALKRDQDAKVPIAFPLIPFATGYENDMVKVGVDHMLSACAIIRDSSSASESKSSKVYTILA
jgi:hypothetical protein